MTPIILQTFNRLSYTMQVIAAIKNYILYPHQLIVIDNASTDGTRAYLESMKSLGYIDHLILNETNLGIAEPKNQGLEIVKELTKTQEIKYVVITDNDIVPPFIRPSCVLTEIVKMMDKHPEVGMCGVDLNRDNSPNNQEWWWRLRQHPNTNPTFAEIAIGFWFSVIRFEYFQDFKFSGESLYGRVDESLRNYITSVKKCRIGLLKGVYSSDKKETISKLGIHLGWSEDLEKLPEYVLFKKQERYKAELAWKEKNRKW
jgi:glycosyltransferase involved in cell wall biosynthesis